jgi:hypothetical protein
MRTGVFVEGLSNEQKFHASLRAIEARGAPEASWLLVEGEPGFGKSKLMHRFAVQRQCVFVRAKADWTPAWMLRDLADVLNAPAAHRTEALFKSVLSELMTRQPIVMVDEFDHALHSLRVTETLRDLTDASESVLIAGGMKGVFSKLKRYQQIRSRVGEVVNFSAATAGDIKTIAKALIDVPVADDLIMQIQRETGGRLRDIMNALAKIEARMKHSRSAVTVEMWGGKPLVSGPSIEPRLVVSNG